MGERSIQKSANYPQYKKHFYSILPCHAPLAEIYDPFQIFEPEPEILPWEVIFPHPLHQQKYWSCLTT